jgi:hypothetical protein
MEEMADKKTLKHCLTVDENKIEFLKSF